MELILIAAASLATGVLIGRWKLHSRHAVAESRVTSLSSEVASLIGEREVAMTELVEVRALATQLETTLEHERQMSEARRSDDARLVAEFDRVSKLALAESREALTKSAEESLKLANERAKNELAMQKLGIEGLVKPVRDNLLKLEQHIHDTEKARREETGGLFQQMREMATATREMHREAADLKSVLRSSSATRGRWGEIQLRRVVELAGMSKHCDFSEQTHAASDDGNARADLVAHLPGNIRIAVDAKVPYDSYERAQSSDDAALQQQLLNEHAKRFRAHVDALSKRDYPSKYEPSCGFAVLFVPGEALLDAACTQDVQLWEHAASKNILLATPSTLIALLRMAALGWRQQAQAENAIDITMVGKELHKRLAKAGAHIEKVGRGLGQAVGAYNEFVGSMESRVMPQARKLSELGAGESEAKALSDVAESPRVVRQEIFLLEDELLETAAAKKRRAG